MKTLKYWSIMLIAVFALSSFTFAQINTTTTTIKKSARQTYPHMTVSLYGGGIFPLPKILNQSFKPGGMAGLDVGYRINKEVGIYGKFGYYYMASKITGAPVGSYLEFSAGPRYYFIHPKLKAQIYGEGGVGAYNFRQRDYVDPTTASTVQQINNVKAGLNAGLGATLPLSDAMDLMVKSKYHIIFTPNGSTSFVTVGGGFEFRFK